MSEIKDFIKSVRLKNSNEPEFIQAVEEFSHSIIPFLKNNEKYQGNNLLNRIIEPERVIIFRVPWVDDNGVVQVNRG